MGKLILVTGGAASGKSEYAEARIREMFSASTRPEKRLVYLATMYNDGGPEAAARIRRHRALRSEKGFETIEQPCCPEVLLRDGEIWKDMKGAAGAAAPEAVSADCFVLLEDLGNLLANERYLPEGRLSDAAPVMAAVRMEAEPCPDAEKGDGSCRHYPKRAAGQQALREYILKPLLRLMEESAALVIVSNEIFSDGEDYPEETMWYIRALGSLHQWISETADEVTEVVCGIPLQRKSKPAAETFVLRQENAHA